MKVVKKFTDTGMKKNNTNNKLSIATFNVIGLKMNNKQKRLMRDVKKYEIDICCLKETKISKLLDVDVEDCRLMCLPSKSMHYRNRFIIANK